MCILSTPIVLANNIHLNVDMPSKVNEGDNFTINVNVNPMANNITGFECAMKPPFGKENYIKIINVKGNEKIKKEAGKFYSIDKKNSSVSIKFISFNKPLNSDFHLMTIKAVALKSGNLSLTFEAVASDKNGEKIPVDEKTINLLIINNSNNGNDIQSSSNRNFLSSLINALTNFLKSILGG
ncbi:cellulosome anchoring protein cohesin region [Methanothermococcus okinawensis IH1]|uniref:Cellulosome anchoring protein cohesin region n=2 Tax=Methanothermococcus okinawensis TaxID=155863 RepID=F8AJM1_METOI|nr:cellulosome anchoring protein cohesin region [Methanothermococcus okinawensis IH1]